MSVYSVCGSDAIRLRQVVGGDHIPRWSARLSCRAGLPGGSVELHGADCVGSKHDARAELGQATPVGRRRGQSTHAKQCALHLFSCWFLFFGAFGLEALPSICLHFLFFVCTLRAECWRNLQVSPRNNPCWNCCQLGRTPSEVDRPWPGDSHIRQVNSESYGDECRIVRPGA